MYYCMNKQPQTGGDHEVHKYSCDYLPDIENRIYLGYFDDCHKAVDEAKKHFLKSNSPW